MKKITIKDLAKLLAVNPSTVSRALKDHPDISLEMRARVKEVAAELGYSPNWQAISFRKRRSRLIGLIIPDMNMYFFPPVIKAIERRVRQEGYNLIVLHSNNQLQGEKDNVDICRHLGVEGLLVSLSTESENLDHLRRFRDQEEAPVVLFDRVKGNAGFPTVVIQDEIATRSAIKHLAERGRKSILGLFGDPHLSISKARLAGYRQALAEFGIPAREDLICHAYSELEAQAAVRKSLLITPRPDAIFAMSDELLVGVMQGLSESRINIPDEIAVIAISDGMAPTFWNPSISFVEHSGTAVGATSASFLFDLIEGRTAEQSRIVPTYLMAKAST
ncbi:MAG TPA: LacI family DNA-binding transcriptional regulator [Flavilitoribacter sp.]|mgnify:CR=1 FL=1|nr:LacI family DNA-binding transcriptional regulator [Flavilitoribacter sp.]